MRIKNQTAEKSRYIEIEKKTYNKIVSWIKNNVDESLKSKAKIIQAKLFDFFKKEKRPTTTKVVSFLNLLKTKYLSSYNTVNIRFNVINSIDNQETLFFNVFLDFNGIYTRPLIERNILPNIDGKTILLNIEIKDEELSEVIKKRTIEEGDFEEL